MITESKRSTIEPEKTSVMRSNVAGCLLYLVLTTVCLCTFAMRASVREPSPAQPDSADQPASVVIVVDTSSDAKGIIKVLKKAASNFAQEFSSDDELALFASHDNSPMVQSFTSDNLLLQKSLDKLESSGKFAGYHAVDQALQYTRNDAVNDKQAVVAFVNKLDGADMSAIEALQNTRQGQRVPLYFIALGHSSWQSQESAQRVAVLSGGAA